MTPQVVASGGIRRAEDLEPFGLAPAQSEQPEHTVGMEVGQKHGIERAVREQLGEIRSTTAGPTRRSISIHATTTPRGRRR